MTRAFLALPIPAENKKYLSYLQNSIACFSSIRIRLVKPEHLHLTLKFFGSIDTSAILDLKSRIRKCLENKVQTETGFSQCGVFPNLKQPRIIWLGMENAREWLSSLAASVEANCTGMGADSVPHSFKPHVTLGRIKTVNAREKLSAQLNSLTYHHSVFTINKLILFKSILHKTGVAYEPIEEFMIAKKGVYDGNS